MEPLECTLGTIKSTQFLSWKKIIDVQCPSQSENLIIEDKATLRRLALRITVTATYQKYSRKNVLSIIQEVCTSSVYVVLVGSTIIGSAIAKLRRVICWAVRICIMKVNRVRCNTDV